MDSKLRFLRYLFLLLSTPLLAQGVHHFDTVLVKGNGVAANVVPYASIRVCVAGTGCNSLAPIYSDIALTQPLDQPVVADAGGNYSYYAASGCVDEQFSTPGQGNVVRLNDCIFTGAGGTGTVTSVGLNLPGIFSVAGSPITTAGTLSASLSPQTANFIWAGPTSGSATAPAFRALVAADLPLATGASFGAVKPDNSTITITGGVISSASGGLSSFTTGNLSPIFTATLGGSPITTPALAFTLSSTSQNFFLAGPTSGSGVPSYRAIVVGDVPTLNQNTTGTASNLSGTPALPNGTTATTQTVGDNTTKIATDAFVLANSSGSGNTTSTALTTNTLPKANGEHSIIDSGLSDDGTTLTYNGTGVGAGCLSLNATQICLTAPPYYASNSGLTSTTTSGTFGVGTTGSVASCSTFLANEGVLITGAGAAGANYIGTVVSCSGTTLTVTPTTATSVTTGHVVQHDETAAFLAAFAAIAANSQLTGTIWLPDGTYLVNGPLLDTSGANAILPLPKIGFGTNTLVDISIKGFTLPSWNAIASGAAIQTSATVGNLFGGYDSSSSLPNFTNVKLEMEKLTFVLPPNSGAVAINAQNIQAFQGRHLFIGGVGTTTPPSTGAGILMPMIGNEVQNELDDVTVVGFFTGFKLTEHTHAGRIYSNFNTNCIVFDNGTTPRSIGDYEGNTVQVDYLWTANCVNSLVGGSNPFHSPLNISVADLEETTGNGVLDTSNLLYGIINIQIPGTAVGPLTPCNANVSGGTHLTIHYLNCQPEAASSGGPPVGLIEDWLSQEGLGTTIANSGYDFTNAATTSATWATAAGFTGNVATYNGTSSISTAASATNTNFDGTLPFTVCVWFNSNGVQAAFARIVNNVDGSSSTVRGWDLALNPSGGSQFLSVILFNDFTGGNFIAFTGSVNVPASVIHLLCVAYDGSKSATSAKIYLDGVVAPGTETSTLTGTIAGGHPVTIGGALSGAGHANFFNGAIGRVRIFNRMLSAAEVAAMKAAGPNAY